MSQLFVGDLHVQPNNVDESDRLLELIEKTAIDRKVKRIVLAGDLFHTHNLVRLEVLDFWNEWLERLSDVCETVVLVGNHDLSGNYDSNFSALSVFWHMKKPTLKIIDTPQLLGDIGYVPYIHDNEKFIEVVNGLAEKGAKHVVSHTTYEGSKYESGIFAPGGVSVDRIDSRIQTLYSGHIHSEQAFARVWYPGTPRWLTNADANLRKGIWLLTYDGGEQSEVGKEFISSEGVCTPIVSVDVREGEALPESGGNRKVLLNLIGSSDWITRTKHELQGSGFRISSKITDTKKTKIRKKGKTLLDYIETYETDKKEKLITYMRGLNLV